MENAITAALSKQLVLQRALDVTANNVANQTTSGFKAEKLAFREFVTRIDVNRSDPGTMTDPMVSLVFDPDSYTDFSGSALTPTYGELDFAIDGEGFFGIETGYGVKYTRDGRFDVNQFGELVTQDGARVLDIGGAPIIINPENGPLVVTPTGELQQDTAQIGQIAVFQFADMSQLRRDGSNLFSTDAEPNVAQFARMRQGFLETSNVAPITAMTDMVEILRAYEQTARVLETANELARDAVERLSDTA